MIGIGSSVYPPPKDMLEFIGLSKSEYKDVFNSVANNWRFCMKKSIKNGGTQVLKQVRQLAPNAWKEKYGDDLKYLISDTFEKITLYENKAKEASAIENEDGTYEVTFTVEAKKVYSDSVGTQTTGTLNDWLEVGVLGDVEIRGIKQELPIHIEKVLISDSLATFSFIVNQKPTKAGIDPMNKFVDRDIDDNLMRVDIVSLAEKEK